MGITSTKPLTVKHSEQVPKKSADNPDEEPQICEELSREPSYYDGFILDWDLSPDLLTLIMLYVPDVDLLKSCRLVCKTWNLLIDRKSLWKQKAMLKGHLPKLFAHCNLSLTSYKLISLKNPIGRNFIANPYGEDGMKGWITQIENNWYGSKGFEVEKPPKGADSLEEFSKTFNSCFSTTHYLCRKYQEIDLEKEGCCADFMFTAKPHIYICDLYAARFDCACYYKLEVTLTDENLVEIEKFSFAHEEPQWTGGRWAKVEHTFTNTEKARYIKFIHEGKDRQFWAGQYGSKMTGSTVVIKSN